MRKLKFQLDRKSLEINYKLSSFDRYKNIVMKYGITVRKIKKNDIEKKITLKRLELQHELS